MAIERDTIETLRAANGATTTLGTYPDENTDGEAPYGFTLIGSINRIENIADRMDQFGVEFSDLPEEKQQEFELAHEALQFHVSELCNEFADNVVGSDDGIELPNGNTVDLPKQAMGGGQSKDIPNRPDDSSQSSQS